MKKIIKERAIYFYDENDNEIMYIDHSTDECIWFFNSDKKITLRPEDELYSLINNLMNNKYSFSNDELENRKDKNILTWYSDCYYNPDDELSTKSVSYLTIKYVDNVFKLWCVKPIYEIIGRNQEFHYICFSPCGNGKYVKNNLTGLTLQDDFIFKVYHKLLKQEKTKKLSNKYYSFK